MSKTVTAIAIGGAVVVAGFFAVHFLRKPSTGQNTGAKGAGHQTGTDPVAQDLNALANLLGTGAKAAKGLGIDFSGDATTDEMYSSPPHD